MAMTDTLNTEARNNSMGTPPWVESTPVSIELDVRPFHRRGEEPFSAIMAAAARVGPGEVLRLRNTFEPFPLYHVLGRQGFAHWTVRHAMDDWEVRFFRLGGRDDQAPSREEQNGPSLASDAASSGSAGAPPASWPEPAQVVTIDVSELVPPEPMVRILEAAAQLEPGQVLLVHHVRRPVYLYPRLDALGYVHETRELSPDTVEIMIRRPAD